MKTYKHFSLNSILISIDNYKNITWAIGTGTPSPSTSLTNACFVSTPWLAERRLNASLRRFNSESVTEKFE